MTTETTRHRITFTVSDEAYEKLAYRIESDAPQDIADFVRDAVYQLVDASPELSKADKARLDRIARREAALEAKKAQLAASATHRDFNPLLAGIAVGDAAPQGITWTDDTE